MWNVSFALFHYFTISIHLLLCTNVEVSYLCIKWIIVLYTKNCFRKKIKRILVPYFHVLQMGVITRFAFCIPRPSCTHNDPSGPIYISRSLKSWRIDLWHHENLFLLQVISSFVSVYKTFQTICLRRLIWKCNTKTCHCFTWYKSG